MRLRTNLAADAALLLTTLIWGSTFVIAKELLTSWPPFAYLSFRFALASLAFALLFPRHIFRASREEWRAAITLGLLVGGGFALQTIGQVYTTPAKSAFITGLTTPLVPIIAYLLTGARPSRENAVGITLASLGGALILMPHESGKVNLGDLVTLASTICFALHIVYMSLYARRHDIKRLSALQIGVAAICFIALWPLERAAHSGSVPLVWSGRVLWQIIYLALIATVLTFLLWTWGQARASATHAAIIFSLEPVFATLFALAVRGGEEWFGLRGSIGAALVLIGVIASELRWTDRLEEAVLD
ncbi:DMT family transporter [Pyrinomonas methylaliphatogenes]|jgi:drug/metabolite transporter (DMT)-like permease|uniref:DMT(Drug/metabolite transporter) superfamily permease n=1 Tax=Pyrinomonas methylaliphatogenes TaxID=454194 RepID=A0A0B6WWX9_9BACT|nr:DMT family transporter [Pyrinomonas methylaliphatogenes]MBX5479060.1 DMT family transporter [Pyrinomonas methylaliphatogenes]CDM64645.1 DMT(drug/metabolite transporter) superfamily permease [Pyrinomonas methylaliphatogenes]